MKKSKKKDTVSTAEIIVNPEKSATNVIQMGPGGFLVLLDANNECFCIHNAQKPEEYEKLTLLQQMLIADPKIINVHFVRMERIVDILVNFGVNNNESEALA